MDARLSGHGSIVAVEEIDAGGVPAAWHGDRRLSERGTLLYLHGGAWCLHLPGTYRRLADRLSAQTGLRVLLPDYRLAPEHPFPAAVDDCFATYRWLVDQFHIDHVIGPDEYHEDIDDNAFTNWMARRNLRAAAAAATRIRRPGARRRRRGDRSNFARSPSGCTPGYDASRT